MACRYIPDPSSCRPTYLVIFKGDDTNFPGNQRIDLVIDTELDLTGIKAHFRFMDFVQDFNEIPADKSLQIVIPNEKTSAFPLGSADASLTFEDASGKIRTVSNRIHVVVTNSVQEAYNNQDTQSITVTVTGTVTWNMIQGKPNASDSNPLMDGEPSAGESSDYSRGDHRHPSDTSKRGLEDFDVRGAPQGEGAWFVLDDDRILTYRPDEDEWREEIASVYKIIKSDGQYELEDDLGELIGTFTLTESGGYSAIVGEQQIHIIGYVDKLVKESQIPTVPTASTATPQMDSTNGSSGSSSQFARGDHSHPSDKSKLDGAAAYPAWEDEHLYSPGDIITYKGRIFRATSETMGEPPEGAYLSLWNEVLLRDLKQDALTSEQIGYINAVPSKAPLASPALTGTPTAPTAESGTNTTQIATTAFVQGEVSSKADKVAGATAGNLASLTAQGNLADSGAKASDFATPSDLPYRLVEPGKWEFSDGGSYAISGPDEYNGTWFYTSGVYVSNEFNSESEAVTALTLTFTDPSEPSDTFTATRASLPGQLLDRAGNLVVVSGDTTLTLPDAITGYCRDFLVRLEISGSTVPTITFAAPTGETITYETDGDEFPVPDEIGNWVYSFTEDCVAHTFAVSLKKVNEVAQGGS